MILSEYRWQNDAACKGKTSLMFPKEHKDISYLPVARGICSSCPVQKECLDYALQFPPQDMHGVWAGFTSRQLATEQRKRGITPIKSTLSQAWSAIK